MGIEFSQLFPAIAGFTWQHFVMIAVGGILIYLAIAKEYEPTLLLPMGFGAILVNIPWSSALEIAGAHGIEPGVLKCFQRGYYDRNIPLLIFILLSNDRFLSIIP